MRILYVAQRVPYPPNRGDKLAAYHAVRFLAARHRVTVAALASSPDELGFGEQLRSLGLKVELVFKRPARARLDAVMALAGAEPLSVAYYRSTRLRSRLEQRAHEEPFDVAISFSSSTAPYALGLKGVPLIADFVDLDSQKWACYARERPWPLRELYALEARRLLRYETDLAGRAFCSLLRTQAEQEDARRLIPGGRFEVLRNGVDLDYFAAAEPSGRPDVVFTGVMDYYPNAQAAVEFCDTPWPLIRAQEPAAKLWIVGANPTRAVRELARRPGVEVTGAVPDVRPYVRRARLAIAPLRIARGVQNKILEALAMGRPVVASPAAARGIEASAEDGLLPAGDPAQFADAVVGLIRDAPRASVLGRRGRLFVERRHSWDEALAVLERLIEEATRRPPEPEGRG